jgi:hypothetical protein
LIEDFELNMNEEGEYSGYAAVHMNGKLKKLRKLAKNTARVEKQSASKLTKALMSESKFMSSRLGDYVASSMGNESIGSEDGRMHISPGGKFI